MKIVFTITSEDMESNDFMKVVEMVAAIPHMGSFVDVGEREPKTNRWL